MNAVWMTRVTTWFKGLTLKQKLIAALAGCSFGASFVLAWMLSGLAARGIEKGIEEKLSAIGQAKALEIELNYAKMKKDLDILGNSKFIQDALVAYESVANGTGLDLETDTDLGNSTYFKNISTKFNETFQDYLSAYPLSSFAIVLNNGSVVSQTGADHILGKNLLKGTFKDNPLNACFKAAHASGAGFTDLFTGVGGKGRAYFCSKIVSKYDRDGYKKDAVMGVLVGDLKWDFFNAVAKFEAGLGESGEIFLMNKDGVLKTHPRKFASGATLEDLAGGKWKQALAKDAAGMLSITNYDGNSVFAIQRSLKLDGLEWVVATQVDVSEARAPVTSMQRWAVLMLLLTAVVVAFVGLAFSTGLARRFALTAGRLITANREIVSVSSGVSDIATSVHTGTQQQGTALTETSSALEELTSMVDKTSELAANSKVKSENCEREAATGLGKINNLLTAIGKVDQSSELTYAQVEKANQSFQDMLRLFNTINSKTQVINDIAFQTKLLSFNASVEAARAGEHGKGFAVVAEEVGKLAVSVSGAAAEINNLLLSSTSQINGLIEESRQGLHRAMAESKNEITTSKSIANECNQFFASLSALVGEINQEMAQISNAAEEQKAGIGEINKAVSQISIANSENVKNVNGIFDLSRSLENVVQELTHSGADLESLLNGDREEAGQLGHVEYLSDTPENHNQRKAS